MRKHWKKLLGVLTLFALICISRGYPYLELSPFQNLTAEMLSLISSNEKGETVVVDHSGKRLFKTDSKGKVQVIQYGKKNQEQFFYEARDLTMDSKGNYYVLDIQRRESGRWVQRERILKYDADGNYIKTIIDYQYDEHEMVLKNRINRIDIAGDALYYYVFTEQGFCLYNEEKLIKEYFYPDAELMLVDFSYDIQSGESAVITKKGEILKTAPDGTYKTFIPITVDQNGINYVPWHGGYDKAGNYYYIDIGTRIIYKITPDGRSFPYLSNDNLTEERHPDLETIKKTDPYYVLNVSGDLLTINSSRDQIVRVKNGTVMSEKEYPLQNIFRIRLFLIRLSTVFLFGIGVILLIWFIGYLKQNNNWRLRIITGCIAGAMGLTVIFTMLVIKNWTSQMTEEVTKRASSTGQTIADQIPGDALGRIHRVDDYMDSDYEEIRSIIRSVLAKDESYVKDLYCVLYRIQDGMTTAAYSIEDYSGAIYPYADTEMSKQMMQTFQSKEQLLSVSTTSEGIFLFTMTPIYDSKGNGVGMFEVGTNMYEFRQNNYKMIFEIILNAFVIAIMAILVIFELLVYSDGKKRYEKVQMISKENSKRRHQIPVLMTRMFIFVMSFATGMTRGFLPLFVMKQSKVEATFGLSYEILLSFALSAEVFFNAIFAFAGDKIIRKIGRRKAAILGSILFTAGMGLRAVFPTILFLIIGNSIMGSGAGILVLVVQIMLAEAKGEEKEEGFAGFTAGSLSGANCGVVFGAFLIHWINYQAIFGVVAIVSLYLIWFVFQYIDDGIEKGEVDKQKGDMADKKVKIGMIRFLLSPRILIYYVGIVTPMVAAGYFLSYLFPILASGYGISETNIGYACLLNGLCIICLGNVLMNYFNQRLKDYQSILFSAILYAAAFMFYAVHPSLFTLLLTLILLGLADGFGIPTQGNYYTTLHEVENFGYDRSMSVYSLLENLSQVLGTFLFGKILIGGVSKGLFIGSIMLAGFAVAFALINHIIGRKAGKERSRENGI